MYSDLYVVDTEFMFSEEKRSHDDIYGRESYNALSPIAMPNSINNDIQYNKKDFEISVFNTSGKEMYTLHKNNILTPIREKRSLNNFTLKYLMDNKFNYKNINGVYIITTYNIHNDYNIKRRSLIKYLLKSTHLDLPEQVKEDIRTYIENLSNRNSNDETITIRLITFISDMLLDKHINIYNPLSDLCIVKGDIDSINCVHPRSRQFESDDLITKYKTYEMNNVFAIEIVDNNNPNKPYYINIGNRTEPLRSTVDYDKPNGVTVVTKKKHSTDTERVKLDDATTLGIFEDHKSAVFSGNKDLELVEKKFELELDKLRHEKEKMEHEIEVLKTKHKHELNKMQQEKEMLENKLAFEIENNKTKASISRLDRYKKLDDYNYSKHKNDAEFTNMQFKFRKEKEMLGLKMEYELVKYLIDVNITKTKFDMDMLKIHTEHEHKLLNNVISTVKSILK